MTTISSATSRASSWSWVTNTVVTCTSSCSRRSQSRSSLRTLASSAPNGSSSSSTLGSTASARASAMRCRWPPESCEGSRCANCDRCTSSSSSSTRRGDLGLGPLADLEAEGDVLRHGHVLERRRSAGTRSRRCASAAAACVASTPSMLDRARVGRLEPGDDPQQRGLAAAGRAEQGGQLAGGEGHVDVVEGDEVAEALVDAADLDAHERASLGRRRDDDDDAQHR